MAKNNKAGAPDKKQNNKIEFRLSGIHGMGGFAARKIKKGAAIIQYVGPRMTKEEAAVQIEAGNTFVFTLDDEIDLDGSVDWNPARYINHSCEPNALATVDKGEIWIEALRDIEKSEEITYNYGHDFEDYKHRPCACGYRSTHRTG